MGQERGILQLFDEKMRNAGIEPATCGFGIRRSTTELIPHATQSNNV